jgi:hypothetical protein
MKYIFLWLASLFLFFSLYLPSRSLFALLIGCIVLLIPVNIILKSSSAAPGRSMNIKKRLLVIFLGIIFASPFTWYGYCAAKEVYGFFSQTHDDIAGIAFFEIKSPRRIENNPTVIVRQTDQISDIMGVIGKSVSHIDPRRVERNYLMQIKHLDGTSYFASIGRMNQKRGCILFSSRFGLWGWEFGGYDNPQMIQVLSRTLGLWPVDPAKE